jgi:hypothetical protein
VVSAAASLPVAGPLPLGAEAVDELAHHVGDAHGDGGGAVGRRDLDEGERAGHRPGLGPAVLGRQVDGQQAELGEPAHQVVREAPGPVVGGGHGGDAVPGEGPCGGGHRRLGLGGLEVHAPSPAAPLSPSAATPR